MRKTKLSYSCTDSAITTLTQLLLSSHSLSSLSKKEKRHLTLISPPSSPSLSLFHLLISSGNERTFLRKKERSRFLVSPSHLLLYVPLLKTVFLGHRYTRAEGPTRNRWRFCIASEAKRVIRRVSSSLPNEHKERSRSVFNVE